MGEGKNSVNKIYVFDVPGGVCRVKVVVIWAYKSFCAEKIPLVVSGGYLYITQEHGVFSKVHLVSFSKEKALKVW